MPSNEQLELLVEAILFAAGNRMQLNRIMELARIKDKQTVLDVLNVLKTKYESPTSSFSLNNYGEDWKLTVKNQYLSIVEKIAPDTELPKSIVETLAIIAWKAPILQSEIVRIRSTKAYDHIELLIDRQFIAREKNGRSFMIKLTPKFFEYFDIPNKQPIEQAVQDIQARPVIEPKKPKEEVIVVPQDDGKTVIHIKEEDAQKRKDFFTKLDTDLAAASSRHGVISQEIKEFLPKPDPVVQQPVVDANGQPIPDATQTQKDPKSP